MPGSRLLLCWLCERWIACTMEEAFRRIAGFCFLCCMDSSVSSIGVAGYSFSSLSVFPYGFSFKEVLMRPGVHHSSLTLSCNLSLGC